MTTDKWLTSSVVASLICLPVFYSMPVRAAVNLAELLLAACQVALMPQVTLLREHCQGPNAMLYTLPTGGYDPRKSSSFLEAAQAELSEEVQLPA